MVKGRTRELARDLNSESCGPLDRLLNLCFSFPTYKVGIILLLTAQGPAPWWTLEALLPAQHPAAPAAGPLLGRAEQ